MIVVFLISRRINHVLRGNIRMVMNVYPMSLLKTVVEREKQWKAGNVRKILPMVNRLLSNVLRGKQSQESNAWVVTLMEMVNPIQLPILLRMFALVTSY